MPDLVQYLEIERCPHCGIDMPRCESKGNGSFQSSDYLEENFKSWITYACSRCGGAILAGSIYGAGELITEMYPSPQKIDDEIPERARSYLKQSLDTLHAPVGSIMLCAGAVDSMLRVKGYKDGSLYHRIDKARDDHLITAEMALWAHSIRLDANAQRHVDETEPMPTIEDAKKCVAFAFALAQFLFVLPARVAKGLKEAKEALTPPSQ